MLSRAMDPPEAEAIKVNWFQLAQQCDVLQCWQLRTSTRKKEKLHIFMIGKESRKEASFQ